jgi:hypothetical protein
MLLWRGGEIQGRHGTGLLAGADSEDDSTASYFKAASHQQPLGIQAGEVRSS